MRNLEFKLRARELKFTRAHALSNCKHSLDSFNSFDSFVVSFARLAARYFFFAAYGAKLLFLPFLPSLAAQLKALTRLKPLTGHSRHSRTHCVTQRNTQHYADAQLSANNFFLRLLNVAQCICALTSSVVSLKANFVLNKPKYQFIGFLGLKFSINSLCCLNEIFA